MRETVFEAALPLPRTGVPTGKFGMWVFLVSEIMFFTGLIGSYIVLRLGSAGWPDPLRVLNTLLLAVNTFVLITSSLTMALAVDAAKRARGARASGFLLITILLGSTFLLLKGYDYRHLWHAGTTLSSNLFGSCYYLLTGFHALHVLSGVAALAALLVHAARGGMSGVLAGRIEFTSLYWHFIDVIWVILFAILCLL